MALAAVAGRWAATRGSDDETRAMKNKVRILLLALDHDREEEGWIEADHATRLVVMWIRQWAEGDEKIGA